MGEIKDLSFAWFTQNSIKFMGLKESTVSAMLRHFVPDTYTYI